MSTERNILVLVTHSVSEFDVLLPLFSELRKLGFEGRITVVVTVRKIYRWYQEHSFSRRLSKKLDVRISFCQMSNKFDVPNTWMVKNRYGYWLIRRMMTLRGLYRRPFLLRQIEEAHVLMHESTNQWASTRFLYNAYDGSKKLLMSYLHGPGVIKNSGGGGAVKRASDVIHLSFHPVNLDHLNKARFKKIIHIGFPQFYDELANVPKRDDVDGASVEKFVLVMSRGADERYLERQNYEYLLRSAVDATKAVYGEKKIVIKRHPREVMGDIERLLPNSDVVVSDEPLSELLIDTEVAINLFGSAILYPLGRGIPAVEFFIESDSFRLLEPAGSPYRKLGIDSVDTKEGLIQFLKAVKDGKYNIPSIISELKGSEGLKSLRSMLTLE